MDEKAFEFLIVDSGGFIRNAPLRSLSINIVTLKGVVNEIRDKATRERLQVLPYELTFQEPSTEAIEKVTSFSKKTGDFPTLSATDIRVLALAYDLHVRHIGFESLKSSPTFQKTVEFYDPSKDDQKKALIAGFYRGDEDEEEKELISKYSSSEYWRVPLPAIAPQNSCSSGFEDLAEYSYFSYWRDPIPSLEDVVMTTTEGEEDLDASDLSKFLDNFLASRSYVKGYELSYLDVALLKRVKALEGLFHLNRWCRHVQSFDERNYSSCNRPSVDDFIREITSEMRNEPESALSFSIETLDSLSEDINKLNVEEKSEEDDSQDFFQSAELSITGGNEVENDSDTGSTTPATIEEDLEIEDDDDEEGWITPSNLKDKRRMMLGHGDGSIEKIPVACMTTDFAMQNVCKQMGIHVVSVDGLLIRQIKTWILRCYACFKTTTLMHKQFCPKCGNKTLKRVSVTVNEDGSQQIHISTRRPITAKGKKFSLPKPKGGKHAINPILSEDQAVAQQRQTRLARKKIDPLDDDYIAGSSPFALRDVTSKSALIGTPGVGVMNNLYWMKRNPNEVGRGTGNRRKKKNRK